MNGVKSLPASSDLTLKMCAIRPMALIFVLISSHLLAGSKSSGGLVIDAALDEGFDEGCDSIDTAFASEKRGVRPGLPFDGNIQRALIFERRPR